MPHSLATEVTVTPLEHKPGSKANFGAVISGVDLGNVDEATFQRIRDAIYTNSVVVIKNQQDLQPIKQFEFMRRLDPDAPAKHGFGSAEETKETAGVIGLNDWYSVPGAGAIQIVGNGYQGDDHYGLKGITLTAAGHTKYHHEPIPKEELQKGQSRFGYFHYDGIVYGAHPSRVTSLRCIKEPKGPDVTVRWDDGTGRTITAKAGCTAFLSCAQLYNLLAEDEKRMAENSFWEAAPHPFVWVGTRKFRNSGLGMAPGGESVPLDKLPAWDQSKVYKYPMVWLNPVTGEKGFMILPDVVRKLYKRASPEAEEVIVEDTDEISSWLNKILDRIGQPEYIVVPIIEEGDIVMWNNWGVLHSAIEYPDSYGSRTMHQCHIASSTAPVGPVAA